MDVYKHDISLILLIKDLKALTLKLNDLSELTECSKLNVSKFIHTDKKSKKASIISKVYLDHFAQLTNSYSVSKETLKLDTSDKLIVASSEKNFFYFVNGNSLKLYDVKNKKLIKTIVINAHINKESKLWYLSSGYNGYPILLITDSKSLQTLVPFRDELYHDIKGKGFNRTCIDHCISLLQY